MKNKEVSFSTALLLKKKGFDVPVFQYYNPGRDEQVHKYESRQNFNELRTHCSAPTQSLVQGWLREKHKKIAWVKPSFFGIEGDDIRYQSATYVHVEAEYFNTWEEALENALVKGLHSIPDVA